MKLAWTLLLVLSTSAIALTLTPCQVYVIQHWPKWNFEVWAVVAATGDNCSVQEATLADVNIAAEQWLNDVRE